MLHFVITAKCVRMILLNISLTRFKQKRGRKKNLSSTAVWWHCHPYNWNTGKLCLSTTDNVVYTEMMTCSLFKKEDLQFPLRDLNFTLYAVMFIAILAGVAFFCLLCVKRSDVERNVYAFGRDGSASSSACTSVTLSPSGPAAPAPPERTSSNHFLFSILFPIFLSN